MTDIDLNVEQGVYHTPSQSMGDETSLIPFNAHNSSSSGDDSPPTQLQSQKRKRYTIATIIVLILLSVSIVGIVLAVNNNKQSDTDNNDIQSDTVEVDSEIEDSTPSEECPTNTKLFSIQYKYDDLQSEDYQSSPGLFTASQHHADVTQHYTWELREGCSSEVILECQPCSGNYLMDTANNDSNAFAKSVRNGLNEQGPINHNMCLSAENKYTLEIYPLTPEASNSCCGFTNLEHITSSFDSEILTCEDIPRKNRCTRTIGCNYNEINEKCSVSLMGENLFLRKSWNVNFGERISPCAAADNGNSVVDQSNTDDGSSDDSSATSIVVDQESLPQVPSKNETLASLDNVMSCPPVGSPWLGLTAGKITFEPSSVNMYCGIFIETVGGEETSLIPYARSYNQHQWEASPGPFASPSSGITCQTSSSFCEVDLPPLASNSDRYILISKAGSMETQKQIARFLDMTTFGVKKEEIDNLLDEEWGPEARAKYVRQQMDEEITSHREYFRRRANQKFDTPARIGRPSHPCSPNSLWRKYTFAQTDARMKDGSPTTTTFEVVEEERDFVTIIYEADRLDDISDCGRCVYSSGDISGYSGNGAYTFSGRRDYIEWKVDAQVVETMPISFRYSSSQRSVLSLYLNDEFVQTIDFKYTPTDNIKTGCWVYTDLIELSFLLGENTIKLALEDSSKGPMVDHLRVGSPPAIIIKNNGHARTIVRSGVGLLTQWSPDIKFEETAVWFPKLPEPPQSRNGKVYVSIQDSKRGSLLDIGNPQLDFTGYEKYISGPYFTFTEQDVFDETASQLYNQPLTAGQELLLRNGSTDPICDQLPSFSDENDAPILARLPNNVWIQFTPTIILESNGPDANTPPSQMEKYALPDGGGSIRTQTGGVVGCSNTPRSIFNEDTCFLSMDKSACSNPGSSLSLQEITLSSSTINTFNEEESKYIYAIQGLLLEDLEQHPCLADVSRWTVSAGSCAKLTLDIANSTKLALETAIKRSEDENMEMKDITLDPSMSCDENDIKPDKLQIQLEINGNCYIHVHPDHLNVYDFTTWASNHPGGAYHIKKWVANDDGWYLKYPHDGDENIPNHPMDYWHTHSNSRNIRLIGRLGDTKLLELPREHEVTEGGTIVCGSLGEVANEPADGSLFYLMSDTTRETNFQSLTHKERVWSEVSLSAKDQLRQRVAWALAQIIPTVPEDIGNRHENEKYMVFYDIFVRHAFGNYLDILREISYSPIMADQLSFLGNPSHAAVYARKGRTIQRADENFAREIMQLFTIGTVQLNDDGTQVLDNATGQPLETYNNDDIESLARAWTGFQAVGMRGNIEGESNKSEIDPLQIIAELRDPFPKSALEGEYIADRYPLCVDLPARSFLKQGAKYRLLGGTSRADLNSRAPEYADPNNAILQAELNQESQLYKALFNDGDYKLTVELENDLICNGIECQVDTLRVVKVSNVFYEFVERPCVQMAFYNGGKKIQQRYNRKSHSQQCANPSLSHAREACCLEDKYQDQASTNPGATFKYEGERMTYDTARTRCLYHGKDLCTWRIVSVVGNEEDDWRLGNHWVNEDCFLMAKVNAEGNIAIVHDVKSADDNAIAFHVHKEHTLNWFKVNWKDGEYPGSSDSNNCAAHDCQTTADGSCVCQTEVVESAVFDDINSVSKESIMATLFLGAISPPSDSVSVDGEGFTAHIVGDDINENTIFEVQDVGGQTLYLRNIRSTVYIKGSTSLSFRNPPHLVSIITSSQPRRGNGEMSLRDVQYETEAVLQHYFHHKNVAPFLCIQVMKKFGHSNPSPRYVSQCTQAFRSGSYNSGGSRFGDGKYGSLEAMIASIILDREATDPSLLADPSHGSIREPILKVLSVLRSMEYKPKNERETDVRFSKIDERIGQSPYNFPTIFSFYLADYVSDAGPAAQARLTSPEAKLASMPNHLGFLNGMFSLIKYGLSNCYDGFSSHPGGSRCQDNGTYTRSYGRLTYQPEGQSFTEEATDLALLLTAGRLSDDNKDIIVDACATQQDKESRIRCMQQLIITTPEFSSTNTIIKSGDGRKTDSVVKEENTAEPYKAIVYLYLAGGVDSFNMLAPYNCAPIDVYKRYKSIRQDITMPKNQLLEVPSNNPAQPCQSFGIHKHLSVLHDLYQNTIFIANAGVLQKPVTSKTYRETPLQLFAHNVMRAETRKMDIANDYRGTGWGGRVANSLLKREIPTDSFSIDDQEIFNIGQPGSQSPFTVSRKGPAAFNENPSISNMTNIIKDLNGGTTPDSGFFSETHAIKLVDSLTKHKRLQAALDDTAASAVKYPNSKTGERFQIVSQLMQTASIRGVKRDIFHIEDGNTYDTHRGVTERLADNFSSLNEALESFIEELRSEDLWESTVIVQFSEFGRTLSPNTNEGSDHAWAGNHFMIGGSVNGGRVLGEYPQNFIEGDEAQIALSRGRMIPQYPWEAMLKGVGEWFGVPLEDMDTVLPMKKNFPNELLYGKEDLFME